MKDITLNLVAWHRDNGDGSNSVCFYNSEEQLDAELKEELAFDEDATTLEQIKSGDDPYMHGSLSTDTIHLQLNEETGEVSLAKSFTVSSD